MPVLLSAPPQKRRGAAYVLRLDALGAGTFSRGSTATYTSETTEPVFALSLTSSTVTFTRGSTATYSAEV